MDIEIVTIEGIETVIIDRGNGDFTSMSKSIYEAQQAANADKL